MINLFEYRNRVQYTGEIEQLEGFLDNIWQKREKNSFYTDNESDEYEVQHFLQIFHKSEEIKSNKYVGVIRFNNEEINLLPKIFYDSLKDYSENDVAVINNHILWWLSYCRKIRFPNYKGLLGETKSNFFEILIYMFSRYTKELLSNSLYQQYEEINRELSYVKGRIDFNRYINENLKIGKWHRINCNYDSFELDNSFNRIIKYVSNMLFNVTRNSENRKNLREILFILDEVSDVIVCAEDCSKISFNSMFDEYETVRDYCSLFLRNSVSVNYKNELKLFAFLIPSEYLFEDFIFGFIDREIDNVKAIPQSVSTYLDADKNYLLKPDLILENTQRKFIADTKYKMSFSDASDPVKSLSQSDLYQMTVYAVRFNIDEVIIFYPETLLSDDLKSGVLIIKDNFAEEIDIKVRFYQLPIINRYLFETMLSNNTENLLSMFKNVREYLKSTLIDIFQKE